MTNKFREETEETIDKILLSHHMLDFHHFNILLYCRRIDTANMCARDN